MKTHTRFAALLMLSLPTIAFAQVWAPGITVDGDVKEWDGQVPAAIIDPQGDSAADGRDIIAIYLANDADNLYVRLQSDNAIAFDGNEFFAIDGDGDTLTTPTLTGFNFLGLGAGTDTLIGGATVYGQSTGSFSIFSATPSNIPFAPGGATTDLEFSIALNTVLPVGSDIGLSFPGGLGSTISFVYLDEGSSVPKDQTTLGTYTLATPPAASPTTTLGDFAIFDITANVQNRTADASSGGGVIVDNFSAGGPGGVADPALQGTHTLGASLSFPVSLISHSFATPKDLTGNTDILIDVYGDPTFSGNLFVGLVDLQGDYIAIGLPAPTTASWSTVNLGSTSGWFQQAPVGAGGDSTFDVDQIAGWRIGIQEGSLSSVGGNFTFGYSNFNASYVVNTSVTDWNTFQ
ncbi:MAG: hypothetical protein ACFCU1_11365 [Sumerlaeia bacterium]